jgi:hydrogenase maturation protease
MSKEDITLIIGLGNPILGDDGIGWVIAEELEKKIEESPELFNGEFEFKFLSLGGLSLMENLVGFSKVFLFDSIHSGSYPKGTIFSLPLSGLPNLSSGHSTAVHDTSLANALEVGRMIDLILPNEIWVIGIETDEIYTFSEDISVELTEAIPKVMKIIESIFVTGILQEQVIKP